MVLMPVVLVRGGRLSEVTLLQAACKSLLCVYTRTLTRTVLPSHMCSCVTLPSKTQPEAEHREQHTGCFQRHQETSTPSHQDFLSRQWYCHGPEELGDRRIILSSPTENSWDFVWPLACHPYYKLILSHEALLLENGSHRHRFVLHSHSSFC